MNNITPLLMAERSSIEVHYNAMIDQLIHVHESIWEEIKHFTWFLSVLVGAPFALLLGANGVTLFYAYGWIFLVIAALISFVAAKIVYREGKHLLAYSYYVHRAEWVLGLYSLNSVLNKVETLDPYVVAKQRRDYFNDKIDVDTFIAKGNKFRLSNIRWLFIILFIIYGIASSGLLIMIIVHNLIK